MATYVCSHSMHVLGRGIWGVVGIWPVIAVPVIVAIVWCIVVWHLLPIPIVILWALDASREGGQKNTRTTNET